MSLIIAEYRCPVHGVFEEMVERPAPDEMKCMVWLDEAEMKALGHEWRGYSTLYCGQYGPWCISAPKPKILSVPCYATVRGGDSERRPGMLDTRPLAKGMSMTKWKDKQRHAQRERRHKMLIDKGLTSKKIQVG